MSIKGIDIYNGTRESGLDLARVKAGGIQYAIVKATEGVNYTDPSFVANVNDTRKAGLLVGAYHFLRATPINQQCHDFLAAISGHGPYCCLAIDVENPYKNGKVIPEISDLGKTSITDRIITLYNAIRSAGYTCPVYVYSSKSWFGTYIDTARCKSAGMLIWLAWYSNATPDNTDRSGICDMWQWCSDGRVLGVAGDTDCDVCYRGINGSVPAPPTIGVNAWYRVRAGGRWLPEVCNLRDFAGLPGKAITDVAARVTAGSVKYRVHVKGGAWLPYVTGCDINDCSNGYAGEGRPIDAVEIYYYTPASIRPYKCAKYRVAPVGGSYYSWQHDNQTTGGQDGYAGCFGKKISKLQICIE